MPNYFELKKKQGEMLVAAEALLGDSSHIMTQAESEQYDRKMEEYEAIGKTIQAHEKQSTIRAFFRNGVPFAGSPLLNGSNDGATGFMNPVSVSPLSAETRSPEYARALHAFLKSGGKAHGYELTVGADGVGGYYLPGSERFTRQRNANGSFPNMNAAMYEGGPNGQSGATGGYAVNVPTIQQIVPLALPDLGLFDASLVIPTSTAIKIPTQTAFGTSALKSESSGTTSSFGGTDFTMGQIELDAWMTGRLAICSWELLQDVEVFQQFVVDDLLKSQRIAEDAMLATGTGNNQPQGVFGNTGNGTGTAYQLLGTAADAQTLLNSLFEVTSTLKSAYQPNASWIMSRATGLAIRKAQMQANLFAPVWAEGADGTHLLLGRPVFYDQNAPALPTTTSAGVLPILYGDFKQGYIVGVRGGAGINVKILDQPLAIQGQLAILAYRRIDAKVRLAEAIQSVKISHS